MTAQLFKNGSKVKVVVVVEDSSLLCAKGKGLVDIANRLAELFPADFDALMKSTLMVVSKVSIEEEELKSLANEVKTIAENNENCTVLGRKLLATLAEEENIALFPIPKLVSYE